MAQFTIKVEAQENLPPSQVGDGSKDIQYGQTIVFTRADFTTNTIPPYSDPEGDAALQLLITSLPDNGVLKLNDVAIPINTIIDFTDIDDDLFTFEPDRSITESNNINFNFQVSDAGSGQFSG